jgi:stress response protein YsnF
MTGPLLDTRTITAFFDDRSKADEAVENLVAAGIPRNSVSLIPGSSTASAASPPQAHEEGFWESLKAFFLPEEDRYTYAEALRRGGFLVSVRITDANYARAMDILDREGAVDIDERAETWRREGWSGYTSKSSTLPSATTPSLQPGMVPPGSAASGSEQVIPVVEEQLRVGKRVVAQGGVRVRSYVVESPVTEHVNLTEEHVNVARRAVDRPLQPGETPFQDRTVVIEEKREEPVISKVARVKEELIVGKQSEQQTKTVSDKVRHTEVEVEDSRGTVKR